MPEPDANSIANEQHIAALDIGSNSFHFVLARVHNNNLQILHSEKYQVKLADGLSDEYILSEDAMLRGLQALQNLAPTVANITKENFRVVATYTLRRAKNSHDFLARAAEILPYDIEVISGHEEARLVYLGASHYLPVEQKRLVIDIGGGSTECIIGQGDKIFALESFNMGCVSWAARYFSDQKITSQAFNQAIKEACADLALIKGRFLRANFQCVTGTSGSIKSIYNVINAEESLTKPINYKQLIALKKQLLTFSNFDAIELAGLKENRRSVICSGLSILIAVFKTFEIDELDYCDYSLREGVIFEALSQRLTTDIHQRTISSLITRFTIDIEHTQRVSTVAEQIFDEVASSWKLSGKIYKQMMLWAIQLHEIGVSINASGYHKHGRYIIDNLDLPGFNQEQTQALSWLIGNQRKKIISPDTFQWHLLSAKKLAKTLLIFRLACLLNKQRQLTELPSFTTTITSNDFNLTVNEDITLNNPILADDLAKEKTHLATLGVAFIFG